MWTNFALRHSLSRGKECLDGNMTQRTFFITVALCTFLETLLRLLFSTEEIFPLFFHRFAQFLRNANLFRKVLLPMVRTCRVDDRHRCGIVAFCYLLRL